MVKILLFYCVGLVFVAQLLDTVAGLQCYDCKAKKGTNNDCEVNVKNINMTYCPTGFVCTSYTRTLQNETNIGRLCSPSNECEVLVADNSHILNPDEKDIIDCFSCSESDGCNSANSFALNSTQFSLLSIVVITLSFLNNKLSFCY